MATSSPRPGETGLDGVLARLCRTMVRELSVSGAAVNVMAGRGASPIVAASAGNLGGVVDDLQFTLGEGPCLEASASGRPVLVADLKIERRWPGYCSVALASGVRGIFAFPLQVGAVGLGVLDIYTRFPGPLPDGQLAVALAYAEVATESLLEVSATVDETVQDPGLRSAIGSRSQIYQAQGMVMVDLDIPLVDALVRMRAFSFAHKRSLANVATEIVAGTLHLEPDPAV